MKKTICALILVLVTSLWATDFTITVQVPTPIASDILATVTAWRIRQVDSDGNPIYANNNALGQAILFQGLRRILRQQCEFDPTTCAPNIKIFLDAKNTAEADFRSEIDSSVTP